MYYFQRQLLVLLRKPLSVLGVTVPVQPVSLANVYSCTMICNKYQTKRETIHRVRLSLQIQHSLVKFHILVK